MFSELQNSVEKDEEEKAERMLLDLWGYQLPVMEKPVNYAQFRENYHKVQDRTLKVKNKSQEPHAEKIKRIREAEKKYRERRE